jgi:AbrB family looped-hinge helix DNA binding protein
MVATISSKGQLVIPASIRRRYHLTAKSKVDFLDTGHSIVLIPLPPGDPFLASRGLLKGKFSTAEFLKLRREERTRETRKRR